MELLSPPPERIINEEVGTASMRETRRWLYSLWQEFTALVSKLTTAQTTADNAQAAATAAQGTANAAQATATAAQTTANAALPAASAVVGGGGSTVPKLSGGLFFIGVSSGTQHRIDRPTAAEGTAVISMQGATDGCTFYCASSGTFNAAATTIKISKNSSTLRSVNAGGTVNTSGTDYAEYEVKAEGCGTIDKGQIVGFDSTGLLTDRWADARSFAVKSSDPSFVGGDTWGDTVGKPPQPPAEPCEGSTEEEMEAYAELLETYREELAGFEARLESERQKVDRIAYAGKVPVNVYGAQPGDYIVAVQDGDGIGGMVVSSPTYEQYRNAVGRVRKILEDGRAQIAVMVH